MFWPETVYASSAFGAVERAGHGGLQRTGDSDQQQEHTSPPRGWELLLAKFLAFNYLILESRTKNTA
jgi:hypothetical protein